MLNDEALSLGSARIIQRVLSAIGLEQELAVSKRVA